MAYVWVCAEFPDEAWHDKPPGAALDPDDLADELIRVIERTGGYAGTVAIGRGRARVDGGRPKRRRAR